MNLREKRESVNLTQQKLAEALGIKRSAVAMWETGKALPKADRLPAIAKILGCTVEELLEEAEDESEADKTA